MLKQLVVAKKVGSYKDHQIHLIQTFSQICGQSDLKSISKRGESTRLDYTSNKRNEFFG
jgi:hypothetical protein